MNEMEKNHEEMTTKEKIISTLIAWVALIIPWWIGWCCYGYAIGTMLGKALEWMYDRVDYVKMAIYSKRRREKWLDLQAARAEANHEIDV